MGRLRRSRLPSSVRAGASPSSSKASPRSGPTRRCSALWTSCGGAGPRAASPSGPSGRERCACWSAAARPRSSEPRHDRPSRRLAGTAARPLAGHVRHAAHVDAGRRQARARLVAAHEPLLEHRPSGDAARALHAAADGRPPRHDDRVRLRLTSTRCRVLGRARRHGLPRAAAGGRVLSAGHGGAGATGHPGPDLDQAGRSREPHSLRGGYRPPCLRCRRGAGVLASAGPDQTGPGRVPRPVRREDEPRALLVGELRSRPHTVLGPSVPGPPGWHSQPVGRRDARGLLARVYQRRVVAWRRLFADSGARVLRLRLSRAGRLSRRRDRPGQRGLRCADARVDPAVRSGAARCGSGCHAHRVRAEYVRGGSGLGWMGADAPRTVVLRRLTAPLVVAASLLATAVVTQDAPAQTRVAPAVDPAATVAGPRPIPGPVYESAPFSRAVARGTRTRTGIPGPRYWVQHARYTIDATLDAARNRLEGEETVVYLNHSPDSLRQLAVHLRQNVFAPASPRREQVPITGGVTLSRVVVNGRPS